MALERLRLNWKYPDGHWKYSGGTGNITWVTGHIVGPGEGFRRSLETRGAVDPAG